MPNVWCLWSLQLSATVQLASAENFNLHLHLLHPIVPQQSNFKILSTKVPQSLLKCFVDEKTGEEMKTEFSFFSGCTIPLTKSTTLPILYSGIHWQWFSMLLTGLTDVLLWQMTCSWSRNKLCQTCILSTPVVFNGPLCTQRHIKALCIL